MMAAFRVHENAGHRLDEIYAYTRHTWGEEKADAYINGLFGKFKAIAARECRWRPVPAAFGVDGYFCHHERHYIYWKQLDDGAVGIVTILHERMHQIERFREEFVAFED